MSSKNNNPKVFGPLVEADEMVSTFNKRSSEFIFQTVRSKSHKTLMKKVEAEEEDGWTRVKKTLKNARKLSMEKPKDEQLEDKVWCMVYKMGYKDLSKNRQFKIEIPKDPRPRQIDVFAKDDEVSLVIECTHCEEPKTSGDKRITEKINNITAFKGQIENAISKHYGRDTKLKPRFILATENVVWGPADLEKCKLQNIIVLTERDIEYYEELTKHLKNAARFQFHAHLFEDIGIPGLSKDVPATKGMMGGTTFYNFLVSPGELLKISYVGHKSSRSLENLNTYQRMLKPKRLNEIVKFLNDGGKFPTNIVVNFKNNKKKSLRFDKKLNIGEMELGQLTLPNQFASAWIIDGQHRLYGYAYREIKQGPTYDKSVLSVLAFENLPATEEMDMFIDINNRQVKVQKNLLEELYADLHWDSPNLAERYLALVSKIVNELNGRKTSPLVDRVIVSGTKKTASRNITRTSLTDGLKAAGLIGSIKKEFFEPGPFSHQDPQKMELSLIKASDALESILELFRERVPGNWELGDRPGGYLCTNPSIRAIFLVIKDICEHIYITDKKELSVYNAKEIVDEVVKYLDPLLDFFSSASSEEIYAFRAIGSNKALVRRQAHGMNVKINMKFQNYNPTGFKKYLNSLNIVGKKEARNKIHEINERLNLWTVKKLKEKFGKDEDEWWGKGVPTTIRVKCMTEWENSGREERPYNKLTFISYDAIARINWDDFNENFSLGENDKSNKDKCLKWLKKANDFRQRTHHPERNPLEEEDIEYINEIHSKVLEYFPVSNS
jgi:DNA sulfur modification protein DndB